MADAPDFATTIAAAYAVDGPSVDLGRGVLDGELHREAVVQAPLAMLTRHGLIAGATGTGKTKTLQGIAEQLSAAGVPVVVADVKGDLSGLLEPGAAGRARRQARRGPRHPVRADRLPRRAALDRRDRPGRPDPRDGLRPRAAAPGEDPRRQRDAGVEPRARLPLRRREGPAAAGPRRPARAADVPGLQGRQGGPRGDRRPVEADRRRAAAQPRRPGDRRRHRVLRRAAARHRRPHAHGADGRGDHQLRRAAGRAGQAEALLDGAHVDARRAVRDAARGGRRRASPSSSSSSTRRICCSATRARRSSSRSRRRSG